MKAVIELTLMKHPKYSNPHVSGETVFSYIIERKDRHKKEAIRRLANYLEKKDENTARYVKKNSIIITKIAKNANFNNSGKIIYKKDFTKNANMDLHLRAAKRLANCLEKKDVESLYFATQPLKIVGKYFYCFFERYTNFLDLHDKEKIIKNKQRGQKAAITRNINKAKKIREKYNKSLFPKGYKSDKRYISLVKNISKQRDRLKRYKKMYADQISSIVGECSKNVIIKL